MENKVKKGRTTCFRTHSVYSTIPKDVWILLLLEMNDARTTRRFSHMSRGFKELVKEASPQFMRIALIHRKESSIAEARKYLLAALYCGNSDAMLYIAHAHFYNNGDWRITRKNVKTAFKWFHRAAANHNIKACALLSGCVGFQIPEAVKRYLKHIEALTSHTEKGDVLFARGHMYYYGVDETGKKTDEKKALDFLKQSAEEYDNEFAQLSLMEIYENRRDFKACFYWASKATKHGSFKAAFKRVALIIQFPTICE